MTGVVESLGLQGVGPPGAAHGDRVIVHPFGGVDVGQLSDRRYATLMEM